MHDSLPRRVAPRALAALASLAVATMLIVVACGGGATTAPSATASSAPTAGPVTADTAVALVLASDPRFAGIGPLDPDIIGQSAWYEVSPGVAGWRVTITQGWGDCQAGCISSHDWVFEVDGAGQVTLVEERGDPLENLPDGEGAVPPVEIPADGGPWIVGRAAAGPTCPVVQDPPDPACEDRPVAGAVVLIRDLSGTSVAEVSTAPDGTYLAAVPSGGPYVVEAQAVDGLLGTAAPVEVTVPDGPGAWAVADLGYDTGIR